MKFIPVLFSLFFLLNGCKSKKAKKQDELASKNENISKEITDRYNATLLDEKLNNYAYFFQEKFIKHSKLLAFNGEITDVTIEDSSLFVYLTADIEDKLYVAKIRLNQEMGERLKRDLVYDAYDLQKAIFIIKLSDILSSLPALQLREGDPPDEDYLGSPPTLYFGDASSRFLFLKGDGIDYKIYD